MRKKYQSYRILSARTVSATGPRSAGILIYILTSNPKKGGFKSPNPILLFQTLHVQPTGWLDEFVAHSTPTQCGVGSSPTYGTEHFGFPPQCSATGYLIKGLDLSSHVYATGHIKDPVPLIEKRRGLSPGGWFPASFIHQVPVMIITRLN